jgi:hypothetical protein
VGMEKWQILKFTPVLIAADPPFMKNWMDECTAVLMHSGHSK